MQVQTAKRHTCPLSWHLALARLWAEARLSPMPQVIRLNEPSLRFLPETAAQPFRTHAIGRQVPALLRTRHSRSALSSALARVG